MLRVVTEKMESCEKTVISITYTGDLKSDSGSWDDSEHCLMRGFPGCVCGGVVVQAEKLCVTTALDRKGSWSL